MKNKKSKIFHHNFLKKNRKASIPITILVIGIILICGMAILSFIGSSKIAVGKPDLGTETARKVNSDTEKFYFYKNMGFSDEDAAEKINAEILTEEINGKSGKVLKIEREEGEIEVTYKLILK